jgi:hypothetical protein
MQAEAYPAKHEWVAFFAPWRLGEKQMKAARTENAIAKDIFAAAFRIHTTLGPGLQNVRLDEDSGLADQLSQIGKGLEEEDDHAKSPNRKERMDYSTLLLRISKASPRQ